MDDTFSGIREFVTAADSGSLTAAANSLGVTGSAVGKAISRLESRLGVQLMHRTTRRMDLTTAGEAYLVSCRRVLEELAQTESFLTTGNQVPVGRLRVDLPTTFGRRHVLPALLDLSTRYERLDLSVTLRDRAVDMVGEGIDLAVRIGTLGDLPDLVARRLGEQKLVICASPAYLKRRGTPLSHADLYQHDCLVGWRRGNRPLWFMKNAAGQTELQEVPVRHDFFDGDALEAACLAGCGLAQLPTWLAGDALRSGALVQVMADVTGGAMPIHVVWQKTWHLQSKVRITVDELTRIATDNPSVFAAGDVVL